MSKKKINLGGIMAIDRYLKDQKKNGKKLFKMVMEETGSLWDIKSLATRESLFALIDHTIDHALHMKAVGAGFKSRAAIIKASDAETQKLFEWLDAYKGKKSKAYQIADAAVSAKVVNKSLSWIQKKITEYRKLKKVASC